MENAVIPILWVGEIKIQTGNMAGLGSYHVVISGKAWTGDMYNLASSLEVDERKQV